MYVSKKDLKEFADELRDRVPTADLASQRVIDGLWEIMSEDLRRYASQNNMPRIGAVSAESGRSLDGVNPVPPYIQREGVALDRDALARLPIDNRERWQYSLFRHDEKLWSLFSLWVRYLRDPRSIS